MSQPELLPEEIASPEVSSVFADIRATRKTDYINNFWRAMAPHPGLLRRTWESIKEVMRPGALDGVTKEMVYLAVSITNQCEYCIASHKAAAIRGGMTAKMFGELMSVVGMANETNRLVSGFQVPVDDRFLPDNVGFPAQREPAEVVREYLRSMFDNPSRDKLVEVLAENVVATEGYGEMAGLDAILEPWQQMRTAFADLQWHEENLQVAGNWVHVRGYTTGTLLQPILVYQVTGRPFRLPGMGSMRVENGKIVEIHSTRDFSALAL